MARGQQGKKLSNLEKELLLVQHTAQEALKISEEYKSQAESVNQIAKGLKGVASIQESMLKGQSASKQIEDGLTKNKAAQQALLMKVKAMKKHGLAIDHQALGEKRKELQVEKEILLEQDKQNKSFKQKAKNAFENIKNIVKAKTSWTALMGTALAGIYALDKAQTQYNKSFGLTDDTAMKIQGRFADIAMSSGRMGITFMTLHKTMQGIAEATGILGSTLRDDVIEEASELSKFMGISNKGMANLALNAQRTGQNMEEQSISMIKGLRAGEEMVGVTVDVKAAFQAASETTGLIRANLGRSYEEIMRVTTKAQALGLTLKDLASISQNMLDFQSSIEAELSAELFIGKQLNLEKARLYALTGDYEKLQDEIVNNIGSEYEFLKMNTLQKQKYAAALGMSVDQMSNLVMRNADLAAIEEEARARGDEETLNMLKQRTIQEQMADLIEKATTAFIGMADGPLGTILNMMGDILSHSWALYAILGAIGAVKLAGVVGQIVSLALAQTAAATASAWTLGLTTAGIGLAIAIPLILGAMGMFSSSQKDAKKNIKIKQYDNLGDEEMVTLERGSAIFDKGESVVRTENFGKLNDTLLRVEGILSNQKLSVNTETHHGTRYR